MAGLTDNVGLLFRIKADSSDAVRDINKVQGAVGGLGTGMAGLAGPAAIATAGLAAIGTVAAQTAVGLFNLAKSTSEFGSKLYDASIQTGLSARSISALNLAAEQSGLTLEQVAGSVSKLNVLVGQAANGNEKAENTLRQYGITAKDTNVAFEQAVSVIGKMADQGQKAAAMQALFKDRTGQLGQLIEQVNGDFKAFTATAEKLGLTLTEKDPKAADDFGDTLTVLGRQAAAVGQQFALEFMPNVTHAMESASSAMQSNQSVARQWGRSVGDIVRGTELAFEGLRIGIQAELNTINILLGQNMSITINWAQVVANSLGIIGQTLSMLGALGAANPIFGKSTTMGGTEVELRPDGTIGPVAKPAGPRSFPLIGGTGGGRGGGGGGGGGKDPAAEAEKRRRDAVQAAKAEMQDTLAIYAAGYAERLALLDFNLANKFTSELNYIRDVGRINLEALEDEKRLNEELLKNENLNLEEKKDIKNKIKVLEIEIRTEKIKTSTLINKQVDEEEEVKKKAHEAELKRMQELSDKQQQLFHKRKMAAKQVAEEERDRRISGASIDGGFFEGLMGSIAVMADSTISADEKIKIALDSIANSWLNMRNIAGGAIDALAQGIGNMVQNWVLMGATGPAAMRKLVASVLAGVAAQSAVLAIFELARGFAALFFNPAEAAAHFTAAALFGSIAVGTALAGRAVAGDLFKQQTTSSTAGSSSGGTGNRAASGGAYSGQGDRVVEAGINSPSGGFGTIVIRDKSGMFDQLFEAAWERNGKMRKRLTTEFS